MNEIIGCYDKFESYSDYIDYISNTKSKYHEYFQEEEFWVNTSKNNLKQLNNYIQQYPNGRYLSETVQYIEEITWNEASRENTKESYEEYLTNYPNGNHANEAKLKIDELVIKEIEEEEKVWNNAKKKNTIKACKDYLSRYPHGKYTKHANNLINSIRENNLWYRTIKNDTAESYEEYLRKYPNGKYANKARLGIDKFKKRKIGKILFILSLTLSFLPPLKYLPELISNFEFLGLLNTLGKAFIIYIIALMIISLFSYIFSIIYYSLLGFLEEEVFNFSDKIRYYRMIMLVIYMVIIVYAINIYT